MASKEQKLKIDGRTITVSNLDKVLYPGGRFTKARVIDYYVRIAKYLLPHLKNRPVTLKRFPNGVFGDFFYEKDAPAFTPDWIETFPVPRRERKGEFIRYVLINDLPTLVWLANLANLEIHPFLHRAPHIDQPTSMVFDCDPGEGANLLSCARVAFMLRDLLKELRLDSWPKVSGSKGLQVYVPLNTATTYEATQALAKALAEILAQRQPKLITAQMPKALRRRKVFIDWSQNSDFKTTVAVYSLRAKSHKPLVSMPVSWQELEKAVSANNAESLYFDPNEAITRAEEIGDLFRPVLSKKQLLANEIISALPSSAKQKRPLAPRTKSSGLSRSRQGSRRRFSIVRRGISSFEINLEGNRVLRTWAIKARLPMRKLHAATFLGERHLTKADFDAAAGRGKNIVWDVGTYEVIEGGFRSGEFRIYLQGAKTVGGEWTVTAVDESGRWRWQKTGHLAGKSNRTKHPARKIRAQNQS
jgi:bifunctional non-homologous end joining protein LigD